MNKVLFGDNRETLKTLPERSVQMCVTSPPYFGLRSYLPETHADKCLEIGSEKTPDEFIAALVGVFREVRRVLADDGVIWVNIGDSYAANRGYQVPFTLMNGDATNKAQAGDGRGMKAADYGLKPKDLIGAPWMLAFALRADGWYLRQEIIWSKKNCMPESVTDRCTKSHEQIFLLSKSERYYFNNEAIKEKSVYPDDERHLRSDTRKKVEKLCLDGGSRARTGNPTGETRNKRSVWEVATAPYSGAHFATFPPRLIEPCILAGSRVGDIVLDPFMGSGTTAQVSEALGRKWIGCELNSAYEELQHERTAQMGMALA